LPYARIRSLPLLKARIFEITIALNALDSVKVILTSPNRTKALLQGSVWLKNGRMFGKFERAKNAVDMYTDGSGLGLFITKEIIEAHPGGTITFTSVEGKGTEFTITIPKIK